MCLTVVKLQNQLSNASFINFMHAEIPLEWKPVSTNVHVQCIKGILLLKIKKIGCKGVCNMLLCRYLKDREQYVFANNCHSLKTKTCYGVPQGSVLEALLCNIHRWSTIAGSERAVTIPYYHTAKTMYDRYIWISITIAKLLKNGLLQTNKSPC